MPLDLSRYLETAPSVATNSTLAGNAGVAGWATAMNGRESTANTINVRTARVMKALSGAVHWDGIRRRNIGPDATAWQCAAAHCRIPCGACEASVRVPPMLLTVEVGNN